MALPAKLNLAGAKGRAGQAARQQQRCGCRIHSQEVGRANGPIARRNGRGDSPAACAQRGWAPGTCCTRWGSRCAPIQPRPAGAKRGRQREAAAGGGGGRAAATGLQSASGMQCGRHFAMKCAGGRLCRGPLEAINSRTPWKRACSGLQRPTIHGRDGHNALGAPDSPQRKQQGSAQCQLAGSFSRAAMAAAGGNRGSKESFGAPTKLPAPRLPCCASAALLLAR